MPRYAAQTDAMNLIDVCRHAIFVCFDYFLPPLLRRYFDLPLTAPCLTAMR